MTTKKALPVSRAGTGLFARFPELRDLYLKHLARYGSRGAAAAHVRLSNSRISEYETLFSDFAEDVDAALDEHRGKIDRAVYTRAIEGVEEPRFGQSGILGHVRRYSDVLLLAYAKRHIPEYRDALARGVVGGKIEVEVSHKVDLTTLSEERRAALRLLLGAEEPEEIRPAPLLRIETTKE